MSDATTVVGHRLRALREAFDSSFALPFESASQAHRSAALCCQLGELHCALPISELSGLFKHQAILPVPARARGLMGVGIFGAVAIPVYDLSIWIGVQQPFLAKGWDVLLGRFDIMGVKVDAIDGYAIFDQAPVSLNRRAESMRYLEGAIEYKNQSYALLDIKRLHQDVTKWTPIEEAIPADE